MMQLRPYQRECVDAVYQHLRTRDDNPCAVVPTAGGKTPIIATICKDAVGQWNGRVLILAHVKELLEQAADKLRAVCPEVKFEPFALFRSALIFGPWRRYQNRLPRGGGENSREITDPRVGGKHFFTIFRPVPLLCGDALRCIMSV